MPGAPHLTLSLSRELWTELLTAALPVRLAGDGFDAARDAKRFVRQLGVRERVAGLLEDRKPPAALVRAKDRAKAVWHRRKPGLYRRLNELVSVRGEWSVTLDHLGTDLRYSKQKVAADAYVVGVAEGTVRLLRENVEFPFTLEKRIGAEAALLDIRYDTQKRAIVGDLNHVQVNLGDNFILQLLNRGAEYLLLQQTPKINPVPILKKDQLEEMVGPAGGPLKLRFTIEDVALDIDDEDVTLKVKFGFSQLQIEAH